MVMSKICDFEQQIMACWNVVDDIDTLYEYVGDNEFFEGMDAKHTDKILNILLGMKSMYDVKFDKMFNQFEETTKDFHTRGREIERLSNENFRLKLDKAEEKSGLNEEHRSSSRMDIIGQNGNDGLHYDIS